MPIATHAAILPANTINADDTLAADDALRLMKKGTAIVWQGDFHNARLLLEAVARRLDSPAAQSKKPGKPDTSLLESSATGGLNSAAGLNFYRHRQKQALRARLLGLLRVNVERSAATGRYAIALRRAPDIHAACSQAWDSEAAALEEGRVLPPSGSGAAPDSVQAVPLRELLGIISSYEWRKKGLAIAELGELQAPNQPTLPNRIYPHYGVFSPVRGEYLRLVADAASWQSDPAGPGSPPASAFDIGTGTGVIAALLARRGVPQVTATDLSPRALACARANIAQLGLQAQVSIVQADLYPAGRADLVVCNPPWLPGKATSSLDRAVYDEGSSMLLGFLAGLPLHLNPGGEAWLILSDLAEHLGLRSRAMLLAAIDKAGLQVAGKADIRPSHPKLQDASDPLHAARQREVTSLWRLQRAVKV